MLSYFKPSQTSRPSPSVHPSPPKPHFITICTDRPNMHSPVQEKIAKGATLAPSPSGRCRQKIRLVSPLKCQNRSGLTTKENSPSQLAANKPANACSPFKQVCKIELGRSPQRLQHRNLNEISNLSINQHLETTGKQAVANKYSAFVIMGTVQQAKNAQIAAVSPFKKRQITPKITINNKSFDISSLKSQIIHVAPFHHIHPSQLHSRIIHEESENSSLKESCEEELREVKDFRREMEAETARMREALKSSRVSQQVCVSHLVYTGSEERAQKRSPSKLFNFEDVPLQKSRMKNEEKQFIPQKICVNVQSSTIVKEDNKNLPPQEHQEINQPSVPQQSLQQAEKLQEQKSGPPAKPSRESWTNSQRTLINELNFLTAKKLTTESRKDEVCVQTQAVEQEKGERTDRMRLAIVRNEECFINLSSNIDKCLAQATEAELFIQEVVIKEGVEEDSQKVQPYLKQDEQKRQEAQPTSLKPDAIQELIQQESQKPQTLQIKQFLESSSDLHVEMLPQQQLKEEAAQPPANDQQLTSVPSIASELVLIELKQSHVESNSASHGRAESNLSLQLEPIDVSNEPVQARSDEIVNPVVQKIQQKAESGKVMPEILSLRSARSSGSGVKQTWSKRGAASKRSIHNSIYL